jgi:hypothetical protein
MKLILKQRAFNSLIHSTHTRLDQMKEEFRDYPDMVGAIGKLQELGDTHLIEETTCLYCKDGYATHFTCNECGFGMCEECYWADREHDDVFHLNDMDPADYNRLEFEQKKSGFLCMDCVRFVREYDEQVKIDEVSNKFSGKVILREGQFEKIETVIYNMEVRDMDIAKSLLHLLSFGMINLPNSKTDPDEVITITVEDKMEPCISQEGVAEGTTCDLPESPNCKNPAEYVLFTGPRDDSDGRGYVSLLACLDCLKRHYPNVKIK